MCIRDRYSPDTGQRVQWQGPRGQLADETDLGTIAVSASGPAPFVQTRLDAGGWTGADLAPADGSVTAGSVLGAVLFGTPFTDARLELRDAAGRTLAAAMASQTNGTRQLVVLPYPPWLRGTFQLQLTVASRTFDVGQVHIDSPAPDAERVAQPATAKPLNAAFHNLELAGASAQNGSLTLIWHVSTPLASALTVFVHVLDAGGHIVAQADGVPAGGRLPTTTWAPGTYVIDQHDLPNPLPAGVTAVEVGLYDAATGSRRPLLSGGDAVRLPWPV